MAAQTHQETGMYQKAVESGEPAMVTGAASGVGRVAALRFAQARLGVVFADLPIRFPDWTHHQRPDTAIRSGGEKKTLILRN